MRLTNNLSKVTLKKGEEAVTGRMGLGWIAEGLRHFGLKEMVGDEYRQARRSNREKEAYEKIQTMVLVMASGGERLEDIENLRTDRGLLDSLGWEGMIKKRILTMSRNLARCKVFSGGLVGEVREFADQILEDVTHLNIGNRLGMKVNFSEPFHNEEKQIGLIKTLDVILEIEMLEDIPGILREARDKIAEIGGNVTRVCDELLEIKFAFVIKGKFGLAFKNGLHSIR